MARLGSEERQRDAYPGVSGVDNFLIRDSVESYDEL